MNGYQKHGLQHSSASSINMWTNCPAAWCARYIFGRKFTFSPPAKAGVFSEDAVVNVLAKGWSAEKSIDDAVKRFKKETSLFPSDAAVKRGDAMPAMIEGALEMLSEYGDPEFITTESGDIKQKKIEIICNGGEWKLPIIGFLDFHYPNHNLVIDMKTTFRMPGAMSIEHKRQGSIYKQATGNDVKFLYVGPKKQKILEIKDHVDVLSDIKIIMKRQERLLSALDKETIKEIIPVNTNSYYWSDDATMRVEMYGY